MKKLFIFKPSDNWSYCGGGLVIIADSFEECQKMYDEKLFRSEEEINKEEDSFEIWVLIKTFDVNEQESRIVLNNYNWA